MRAYFHPFFSVVLRMISHVVLIMFTFSLYSHCLFAYEQDLQLLGTLRSSASVVIVNREGKIAWASDEWESLMQLPSKSIQVSE